MRSCLVYRADLCECLSFFSHIQHNAITIINGKNTTNMMCCC